MKPFPHYRQLDQMDCGPTCLRMVAKHFGRHYTAQSLREKAQISREGVSMLGIAEAAEVIGFKTVGVKVTLEKLIEEAPLPCILHWGQNHFVVLVAVSRERSAVSGDFLSQIWGGRRPSGHQDPGTHEKGSISGREGLLFSQGRAVRGQVLPRTAGQDPLQL